MVVLYQTRVIENRRIRWSSHTYTCNVFIQCTCVYRVPVYIILCTNMLLNYNESLGTYKTAPFQNMRIMEHFKNKPPRAMCSRNVYRHSYLNIICIQPFRQLRTSNGTLITINFRILQHTRTRAHNPYTHARQSVSYFPLSSSLVFRSTVTQKTPNVPPLGNFYFFRMRYKVLTNIH